MQYNKKTIEGGNNRTRMGVLLQFPSRGNVKNETKSQFCDDCECSGRLIVKDEFNRTYVYRCHCHWSKGYLEIPMFDAVNSDFKEVRAGWQ